MDEISEILMSRKDSINDEKMKIATCEKRECGSLKCQLPGQCVAAPDCSVGRQCTQYWQMEISCHREKAAGGMVEIAVLVSEEEKPFSRKELSMF